jgi:hypothetical protein
VSNSAIVVAGPCLVHFKTVRGRKSGSAEAIEAVARIVHHLALDPEPRVQDCDVGGDERHFDLGRATRARPIRAIRAVQALHQVAEALATRGPGAVDGDELCVVGERRGDGIGIVSIPSHVELVFNLADRVLVGLAHRCLLPAGCSPAAGMVRRRRDSPRQCNDFRVPGDRHLRRLDVAGADHGGLLRLRFGLCGNRFRPEGDSRRFVSGRRNPVSPMQMYGAWS